MSALEEIQGNFNTLALILKSEYAKEIIPPPNIIELFKDGDWTSSAGQVHYLLKGKREAPQKEFYSPTKNGETVYSSGSNIYEKASFNVNENGLNIYTQSFGSTARGGIVEITTGFDFDFAYGNYILKVEYSSNPNQNYCNKYLGFDQSSVGSAGTFPTQVTIPQGAKKLRIYLEGALNYSSSASFSTTITRIYLEKI